MGGLRGFGTGVAALAMLFAGVLTVLGGFAAIGPRLDAAQGEGVPGVFRLDDLVCGRKDGGCDAKGTFTAQTGQVRSWVELVGDVPDDIPEGWTAPARDTGARAEVFTADPSFTVMIEPIFVTAMGVAFLIAALVTTTRLFRPRTPATPSPPKR
ncbi:hypothetical protein [Actinocorallia sp. A-T 12471]|uniref:hypothetical protein n=1 Tax=Actinocorallia sp. A-T 12471 TaxID=3089813 RepID=UPI0029D04373|nr:hypothetical protein [Actinocorallia sp. A-T 12471]MDX6741689.1 hypothetical protein [Actinocorallia sp. A-T 12471]